MAVSDWSTTANSNTAVGGIGITGGSAVSQGDNAIREIMAQIKAGVPYKSGTTYVLFGVAGNARAFTFPDADGTVAMLDQENQALTGGATVTSKSLGTLSTGTLTLDMGDRPLQHYTNGGAHTLAPGSVNGAAIVDITNNGSAGAITTSGWTKVTGDILTTTNGHKFRCHCSVGNGGSLLVVQALQ
jgi:hypothetical protein